MLGEQVGLHETTVKPSLCVCVGGEALLEPPFPQTPTGYWLSEAYPWLWQEPENAFVASHTPALKETIVVGSLVKLE